MTNTSYSLIGPSNPLPRGQAMVIYATGLGAVTQSGQFSVTKAPVTVVLNGTELPAAFAGLAPGFIGLYQVNVLIPAATPPGLGIPLSLKVGGQVSNTVSGVACNSMKMRLFGVKLLTARPVNVIKSGEHRFHQEFLCWSSYRFVLKGKHFS